MEIFKEWLSNYAVELLGLILTAVVTYLGTAAKKIYEKSENNKEKRKVVKNVVAAVEQMFKNLHGKDKLEKAVENASIILSEKGITVTELELLTLIESAVADFNGAFNKASWEDGIKEVTSEAETPEADEVEPVELETVETIENETAGAVYQ